MATKRLNMVVAACNNNGIGIKGNLPWRLKGDMAFFRRITKDTADPSLQNAVIMGRKTWESIPEKFRPLAGRVNVIISRNWTEAPPGAKLAKSLDDAIQLCSTGDIGDIVEGLFVIGGSSIYQMALQSPRDLRIYLTRVDADFECDTFLPEFEQKVFQKVTVDGVEEDEKEENGIKYRFEVYDKQ